MPTYSFGADSPLKFEISDKLAERFNDAVGEYYKAQQRFNQKFIRDWDPYKDPIMVNWSKKRQKAWNDFARIYKRVLETDGPFHENDLMEDFLVENSGRNNQTSGIGGILGGLVTLEFAHPKYTAWHRAISFAVVTGALYGFLRDRK